MQYILVVLKLVLTLGLLLKLQSLALTTISDVQPSNNFSLQCFLTIRFWEKSSAALRNSGNLVAYAFISLTKIIWTVINVENSYLGNGNRIFGKENFEKQTSFNCCHTKFLGAFCTLES